MLSRYAGNSEPSFVFPTAIALRPQGGGGGASSGASRPSVPGKPAGLGGAGNLATKRGIEDLDFYIGDEAFDHAKSYQVEQPIRHGLVDNWDHMERYWEQCIFK